MSFSEGCREQLGKEGGVFEGGGLQDGSEGGRERRGGGTSFLSFRRKGEQEGRWLVRGVWNFQVSVSRMVTERGTVFCGKEEVSLDVRRSF